MTSCVSVEKKFFLTPSQILSLQEGGIPKHVAIIMDGNRRWAHKQGCLGSVNIFSGHTRGADVVDHIVESSLSIGIEQLTLFAFSTENWSRSPLEVKQLLLILTNYLKGNRKRLKELRIKLETIGDLSSFPKDLQKEIELTRDMTSYGDDMTLVLALSYGGRSEICRACRQIADEVVKGNISRDQIDERMIESYLDTAKLPFSSPDLLIRTSGEMRISNFLLWQLAYTEVYVTKTLWPDFSVQDLAAAIKEYQSRERRLGK